jgi:hypothetical protein
MRSIAMEKDISERNGRFKMRFCILIVISVLFSINLIAENYPVLVHSFANGNSSENLGLLNISNDAEDQGTIHFPMALLTDGQAFCILDNVNGRLMIMNSALKTTHIIDNVNKGLIGLAEWNGIIYLGNNISGSKPNKDCQIIWKRADYQNYLLEEDLLKNSSSKYYLCYASEKDIVLQDLLKSSFVILSYSKNPNTISNSRISSVYTEIDKDYGGSIDGSYLTYGTPKNTYLISKSIKQKTQYFSMLPQFKNNDSLAVLAEAGRKNPQSVLDGLLDSGDFYPLPNSCYLISSSSQFVIIGPLGNILDYALLKKDYSFDSTLAPSPDGYIYYLHASYENNAVELFKIGPYEELRLGYLGQQGIINDNRVNLRNTPTIKSDIIQKLERGTIVRILDGTKNEEIVNGFSSIWYRVSLWDHTQGWVFGQFLNKQ